VTPVYKTTGLENMILDTDKNTETLGSDSDEY
jgi:hypothetical protein